MGSDGQSAHHCPSLGKIFGTYFFFIVFEENVFLPSLFVTESSLPNAL